MFEMVIKVYQDESYESLHNEPVILIGCFIFLIVSVVFLLNMLIAQLSCAYDAIYSDMVGYARLKRIRIIVEVMPQVTAKQWNRFVTSMRFEKRIEFNEGDVGLAGGVQLEETASTNPTTADSIRR